MICFHYHQATASVPRLSIRRGDRLCHVFSDLADPPAAFVELATWVRAHHLPLLAIQQPYERRQHVDLWGWRLALAGEPAPKVAVRRWLRSTLSGRQGGR